MRRIGLRDGGSCGGVSRQGSVPVEPRGRSLVGALTSPDAPQSNAAPRSPGAVSMPSDRGGAEVSPQGGIAPDGCGGGGAAPRNVSQGGAAADRPGEGGGLPPYFSQGAEPADEGGGAADTDPSDELSSEKVSRIQSGIRLSSSKKLKSSDIKRSCFQRILTTKRAILPDQNTDADRHRPQGYPDQDTPCPGADRHLDQPISHIR